jgi:WD40-like Beta Propeller Repeat
VLPVRRGRDGLGYPSEFSSSARVPAARRSCPYSQCVRVGLALAVLASAAVVGGCASISEYGSDLDPDFTTYDGCPSWSADGRFIALTHDEAAIVVDPIGKAGSRLGRYESVLGWLENPSRVVVHRGSAVFAVARSARGRVERLLTLRPDEQPVAISSGAKYLVVEGTSCGQDELRAVRVRDGQRTLLARGFFSGGAFAGRGGRVTFVADDGLHVRDLDTGNHVRVGPAYLGDLPSLSPDGSHVAFARACAQYDYVNQIHIVPLGPNLKVGATRVLTHSNDAENTEPVFWPDGRRVVYQHGGDLCGVGIDRRGDDRLTQAGGFGDYCPAIAPDGELVAYTRGQSSAFSASSALIVMRPDGGDKRLVPTR